MLRVPLQHEGTIMKVSMTNLLNSTTFQFAAMILAGSAFAAFQGQLAWATWLSEAVVILGIYASKEGVRYSAAAYQAKGE